MKLAGIVFSLVVCVSAAFAQFPVENTIMHTVATGSPSSGPGPYDPTLSLPVGKYRYRLSTSGGTFISNFFLLTNFNSWTPGFPFFSTGAPVPLLFSFYVPPGVAQCSTETVRIRFERDLGLGQSWPAGTFDLKVMIGRNGERGHLVSDDTTATIYYAGFDGKTHQMVWGSGWRYSSVDPVNGWGSVRIAGRMAIFDDGTRILFKGNDARLYQMVKSGLTWTLSQVSTALPNVAGAVVTRNSNEVVFYGSDQKLHQLTLTGGMWTDQIVVPTGGWGTGGSPRSDAIALPRASARIFFVNQRGALCNVSGGSGAWTLEQISPDYTSNAEILAVEENAVYYIDNKRIHRYVKGSAWTYDAMTISTSSEANVVVNDVAFLTKFFGENKVFYKASDGRIYNVYEQAGTWYNYPLVSSVFDAAGDLIAAQSKIFYIHHDKRVHTSYWDGSRWIDGPLSTASQADTEGCINTYTW